MHSLLLNMKIDEYENDSFKLSSRVIYACMEKCTLNPHLCHVSIAKIRTILIELVGQLAW